MYKASEVGGGSGAEGGVDLTEKSTGSSCGGGAGALKVANMDGITRWDLKGAGRIPPEIPRWTGRGGEGRD